MYFKNLFFLFFFYFLIGLSENKNISSDSLLNKNNYTWIITNAKKIITKNKLKKNEIDSVFYQMAKNLENNGYPFSVIEFRYDSIKEKNIYGKIFVEKGNLSTIDSIAVKGYNKFPKYLISRFLEIKKKEKYNQRKINKIDKKLEKNIFIKEYKKNSVLFNQEKTILFLYLEKKHNNSIDGFIGLNNNQEETTIYGKIDLNLSNALNLWELINIKWNKMTENSQELLLNFNFPFIFNSTFLLNTKINILQQNNSYTNKEFISSLELNKNNNFFKLGYLHKRSNTINNYSNNLIKDYKKNLIILKWKNEKNNFLLKKIKYEISNEYRIGSSKITNENNIRQQIKFNFKCELQIFKKTFFNINSKNDFLLGNKILENEKIGVGGVNQIRGFLENSFFSKSINIINLESKYFFNEKSYFSFFYDIGKLHDLNTQIESFGLGLGLNMENDVFLINYAIPKYNKTTQINNSKIHFNYILKF